MASNTINLNTYRAKLLSNTYGGQYEPVYFNGGVPTAITAGTTGQFYRGDKTWSNVLTSGISVRVNGEAYVIVSDGSHYNDDTFKVLMDLNPVSGNHGIYSSGYMNNGTFTSDGKWLIKRNSDGTIEVPGNASTASTWATARTLTIGATGKSVNGGADVSWSMDEIMGSSDSTKFYRGDKTWSDTLTSNLTVNGLINNWKLAAVTSLNANDVRTTNGFWVCQAAISNAPTQNHGGLLGIASVGTPCQYFFPDNSLYTYKRWYTSNAWTDWSKISAGYADSSGSCTGNATTATTAATLTNFQVSTTTNLGLEIATNTIGYVSGLTKDTWNYQQTDGIIYGQFYNANWKAEIFQDYRTGRLSIRGKNSGTWQSWYRVLDEVQGVLVYNTSNIGNSSSVTFNDLAAAGNAVGMINAATDNPRGAAGWTHCISLCWTKGTNTSWISQIAISHAGAMYYRCNGGGTIVGKAWTTVLDSANYTSYTVKKDGTGASGSWGISVTGSSGSCTGLAAKATADGDGKTISSTYAKLAGATFTGNVFVTTNSGDHYFEVKSNATGVRVELDNSGSTNHGLWSSGYWSGSAYTASAVWMITRNASGTVIVNGNCTGSSGSCTGNAATATKATQDGSGNTITSYYCTLSTAQTISGAKTFTGNLNIGASGAGGYLNGSATNGGINSIRIGDDVWLGDCNSGGIMGMKSTGAACGFYMYNSSGTQIGQLYFNATGLYCNKVSVFAGEIQTTVSNGLRLRYGSYAVIGRNDGANFYWLISTNGAAGDNWNSLRPFQIQLSSGDVYMHHNVLIQKLYYNSYAGTWSSRLIKQNIVNITEADSKKLLMINPITFEYKPEFVKSDRRKAGVIAEELEHLIPVVVDVPEGCDNNKIITDRHGRKLIKSVDYTQLVPYLIKLAQVQQKEIDQLKLEIQSLKEAKRYE